MFLRDDRGDYMQINSNNVDLNECESIHANAEIQLESFQAMLDNYLKTYYKKEFSLDSRIKSVEKMMKKIQLRREQYGQIYGPQNLPDVIGLRVSVDTEDEVIEVSNLIEKGLNPTRKVDRFVTPTISGFKANLYYFSLNGVNIEIQVMTKQMELWTNQTHDEYNSKKYEIIK